MVLPCWYCG